jgi:integrase
MEAVKLRVKDIDFDYKCIQVWNGKGNKHRIVTLANELIPMLRNQIYTHRYPTRLKIRVSVGIKGDLGKALIASNSGSIVKIKNAV